LATPPPDWETAFPGISAGFESSREQEITLDFVTEEPVRLREPERRRSERRADPEQSDAQTAGSLPWFAEMPAEAAAAGTEPRQTDSSGEPEVETLPTANLSGETVLLAHEDQGVHARRARRVSDVAIPRTVMTLWSMLVLAAVALAFMAGLLIGRFLWAPGIAIPRTESGSVPRVMESKPGIDR
jgi:hypothetical protein